MSIALVTGGARGIGRAIGDALLRDCKAVVYADILPSDQFAPPKNAPSVATSARAEGRQVFLDKCDVSDHSSVLAMFDRAAEELTDLGVGDGVPNIVAANAGILYPTRILNISPEEWRRVHSVNTDGAFYTVQEGAKRMVAQMESSPNHGATDSGYWGTGKPPLPNPDDEENSANSHSLWHHPPYRIITTASSAGRSVSTLGGAHYTSSKAAVLGMTRAAAKELGQHNITVNAICPGLIRSEMAVSDIEDRQGRKIEEYEKLFPIERLGEPWEVGALARFLASKEAGYLTGACFDINGGDLML